MTKGSALTELSGEDCILLTLVSGSGATASYTFITASQHTGSATSAGMPGVYSASFALNQFDSSFFKTMKGNNELTFTEIWSSLDRTIGYMTGSLTVKKSTVASNAFVNRKLLFTATNALPEYKQYSRVTMRLFVEDVEAQRKTKAYKLPRELETIIVDKVYYRIRDIESGTIMVPFDEIRDSTRVAVDSAGMYIDFRTSGLPHNRNYTIDLLVKDRNISEIVELNNVSFMVVS